MAGRSKAWYTAADREYPIRVKFVVPSGGLRAAEAGGTLDDWLHAHLGPKMWNWGPAELSAGRQACAYYFRRLEDAHRFIAAFPGLELADAVPAPVDTTPVGRKPYRMHGIGE
ncbi:MAG: hypothetical protein ABIT09_08600 [Croceibacterium sp.]